MGASGCCGKVGGCCGKVGGFCGKFGRCCGNEGGCCGRIGGCCDIVGGCCGMVGGCCGIVGGCCGKFSEDAEVITLPDRDACGKGCCMFCRSEFLGGNNPCVPVSKALAAATDAIAEFSKFLISSLSDREELDPRLPISPEPEELGAGPPILFFKYLVS